jgi:hypothetical protein
VCVCVCVGVCERERERESECFYPDGNMDAPLLLCTQKKIDVCGTFVWAEAIHGAVTHTRHVISVGAMLIRKEMCTSGRKCPRKAGRSRVDFERFGRV